MLYTWNFDNIKHQPYLNLKKKKKHVQFWAVN